jgi:hypothetical protein
MLLLALLSCSDDDGSHQQASRPVTVSEPGASGRGKPFTSSAIALALYGYREKECSTSG